MDSTSDRYPFDYLLPPVLVSGSRDPTSVHVLFYSVCASLTISTIQGMGIGTFLEPLVVITLLVGGTWINRSSEISRPFTHDTTRPSSVTSDEFTDKTVGSVEDGLSTTTSTHDGSMSTHLYCSLSPSLLLDQEPPWRTRQIWLWSWKREVMTPNTAKYRNRCFSRFLRRFPFLVECWYWTLVYWTYQLARAFTAVTLQDATVDIARKHALQLIKLEESLHIFWELHIQHYFLHHPILLTCTNWLYSFIHIPGTIAFLVWLYYCSITRNRPADRYSMKLEGYQSNVLTGSELYQARRRTLAFCNLLAFVVFTLWPCMPPRLLSDRSVTGLVGEFSRSYGFVDTVHGVGGASSVWTQNKFCNQFAAMPSLHFGYSLMIGITITTIPLPSEHTRSRALLPHFLNFSLPGLASKIRPLAWERIVAIVVGITYPFTILVAIVATANHFILDAFAGAIICGLAWWGNSVLLNLLPLEDYLFWILKIHKPEQGSHCLRPSLVFDDCDGDHVKDAMNYQITHKSLF
ncbi:integral membrane protein, variant [Blastomyces dermatitidis ER-3]|uniref:Integral membrane protein, variant n=2 Tax=Ajellomyces dermatitidis TaxID=5039 RepID=A0A0J9EQ25_AJEDA|nr:integral membrane protein, variant [Blastomyces dermatitidis ER-3]EQL36759.1 hypothetical protein, variant [Blastomyces dermatitidis ATCC 26199]KMW68122.1 integral membrane protein, variant [Blastomyces dermatitidis ATCC 18188]OAT02673.1 integral membrane protein, variant [Blastomyces dermatitidis ER-3]